MESWIGSGKMFLLYINEDFIIVVHYNNRQERVVKKKAKKVISKLSFADDEEEEESSTASSPKDIKGKKRAQDDDDDTKDSKSPSTPPSEPALKKSKFGKDPNIDTSFLPDREREEEERRVREELRQEWLAKQQKIKNETIQITYSYWDGSGHRKEVEVRTCLSLVYLCKSTNKQRQEHQRNIVLTLVFLPMLGNSARRETLLHSSWRNAGNSSNSFAE